MLGEAAALGTAACFVFSSLFFSRAGHRIGSLVVNLVRLFMGLGFLVVLTSVMRGQPLPLDASADQWLWLALSGVVGFVIGDLCLFRAFLEIGPRLSTLLMSLAPPIAGLCGWLWLGETLDGMDLLGMFLTVAGIMLAVTERPQSPAETTRDLPEGHAEHVDEPATGESSGASRVGTRGIALGVVGAIGQAVGLVLSKKGMGAYDAFAATQIRVIAGIVGFVLLFALTRRFHKVWAALRDGKAMKLTAAGAFFGPFLGVGLSLLSVQHTSTGVAASIMATTPILIIPFSVWMDGERVGLRSIVGTIVAVFGVVLLFAT